MANEEAVGGFWAVLELRTKEKSFKDGVKKLNDVKNSVKSFAGFLLKSFSLTGGGVLALAAATAAYETKNISMASSLRMSSSELVAWRGAANLTGVSADSLTNSLLELQKKSDRIKLGEVDVGLAKSLGMLGVGYQSFLKQDSAQKMRTVFEKAMAMTDKGKAGELIRDVLGDSGKEMFQYMEMTGQSLDSILAKSKALMFTNDSTRKQAMVFNQEFKATFGTFKEMGSLFFSTFGAAMTPVLKNLQMLIIKNKGLISTGIIKFAREVAKIGKDVFKMMQTGIPFIVKMIDKIGGLDKGLKLLFAGFLALKTVQTASGIAGIVSALTGFSKLKMTGGLLAFAALFLIIQDIALYMKKGKDADTYTGRFIEWLDKIGEKTKWVKGLADALKTLTGTMEAIPIEKMDSMDLANLAGKQAVEKSKKEGKGFWDAFSKSGKVSNQARMLELLLKKNWEYEDKQAALALGVRQQDIGNQKQINDLEITLITEGAEGVVKELRARYNGKDQLQKRIIK